MDIWLNLNIIPILLAVFTFVLTECKQLDDYILHYEELTYNTEHLHNSHMRHKRSLDSAVHLDLNAFDKKIKLRLKNDRSVFTPDFVLEFNGTVKKPDLSFIYSGEVIDKPGSSVMGGILNGVFTGSISIPSEKETYHVENSHRFFQNKPVFHSVIYKESDMNLDPFRERRTRERREAAETGTCGYLKAQEWMREVVQSEVIPQNRAKRHESVWQEIQTEDGHAKYTEQANRKAEKLVSRKKRASLSVVNNGKNSCFMSLMSDPFLYNHFLEKSQNDAELARDAILLFFASHIEAIRTIYMGTTFQTYDGNMEYKGVTFAVQKTKVMTPADCNDATLNRFCQPNIDVSNFLNLNSLLDHDDFCLAYVFTYRDFSAGTLGLAWVGASNSASGGVCERNKSFREKNTQVKKSLNTGIVTTINYGKEVPSKVSQLTFAHEVGHNFGSPHDSGTECAPYGTGSSDANKGNYIMYASATMGDKVHNSEFSSCSKDNITRVIHAVLTSTSKFNCFSESGPFCGNGIVEKGEECDCGFHGDCEDSCCIARNDPNHNKYCELTTNAQCSPSQGPCCEESTCTFTAESASKVCRYAEDCFEEAKCNGTQAVCPQSVLAENGTYCNNYGFTCQKGECAGSLCEKFNWTECFRTGDTSTKEEQESLCKLGCLSNQSGGECVISSDRDLLVKYPEYQAMVQEVFDGRQAVGKGKSKDISDGVKLAPGSPCNNFQGYCDVFYRCRGVDAEGPLSRLKNLIFDPETLQDISNWIVEHWWAVLLMGIGLVLAMGLFIKFCAVHTPSSNPKAKPARKLSETMTLRRRRNQNRQPPPQPQPVRYPQEQELLHDPKYPAKNPQGPPPPYPGSSSGATGSNLGPPHGHGKKGKNRKGQPMEMGRI
ncbi:disintegrin and metalloproteinase domain-containing protein 10-like isoform X3 [Mercenaria mercenaria]|uniref:disintegrin and metalloproteinase domain-containing protein 10-like isoform X3 n=1 Tax=Mercenaria mercenaria TaxID=6596 RepID=UPI00234E965C|nr:disintegrin and metalloproteinase domain-containing protein 10-like isoform X3 [Mercenaria mercenaria]